MPMFTKYIVLFTSIYLIGTFTIIFRLHSKFIVSHYGLAVIFGGKSTVDNRTFKKNEVFLDYFSPGSDTQTLPMNYPLQLIR